MNEVKRDNQKDEMKTKGTVALSYPILAIRHLIEANVIIISKIKRERDSNIVSVDVRFRQ